MAKRSPHEGKIRESIVDGIFYPATETELISLIEKLLGACTNKEGDAFSIIAPHASYSYAGEFIASSFVSAKKRQVKDIVIIAPVHTDPSDTVYLPESKFFLTPLGSIAVNQDIVEELLSCSTSILRKDLPHLEEHCIEVHLPFVKYLYPEAKIVPILMGNAALRTVRMLANALQLTFSEHYEQTLFVVSANMTSHMAKAETENEAQLLIEMIKRSDWKGIAESKTAKKISSCGAGCIATMLSFNGIEFDVRVNGTGSSEKASEDAGDVVTYASIALYNERRVGG